MPWLPRLVLPVLILALFLASPIVAVDPDRFLPGDTDAVVIFNVQQILASPLFKTHYHKALPEYFDSDETIRKFLKGTGLDPMKDIDRVIFSNGLSLYRLTKSIQQGKTVYGTDGGFFCVVKGRFNTARFHGHAQQLAKEKDPLLKKIHKAGSSTVYELNVGEQPILVAIIDGTTIAVSNRIEPLIEAFDKAAGRRKTAFMSKDMVAALARVDGKKSVSITIPGSAGFSLDAELKKVGNKVIETPIKYTLAEDGIDSITGWIDVSDGIKGDVVVSVRGNAAAKDVAKILQEDLSNSIDLAVRKLFNNPRVGPFAEFLKAVEIKVKDARTVTIQSTITAKEAADSLK